MSIAARIRSKLRRTGRQWYRDLIHQAGMDEAFYRDARGSRILIYHGICQEDHTRFNPIFLTEATFEQHLLYYRRYFNVVSLDDLYSGKLSSEKFNICLTFDDGFANNYKYVLPLLEKYQMPASFFITAIRQSGYDILWNDFMGIAGKFGPQEVMVRDEKYQKGKFDKYYRVNNGASLIEELRSEDFDAKAKTMNELRAQTNIDWKAQEDYWLQITEKQIREMAASPYVTIGAHGQYHNDLTRIDTNSATSELQVTKTWLEELIQKPVNSLAFPYGSYNREIVEAAKQTGYTQLLAMDFLSPEDEADVTMRERFTVNPFISPNSQMHATINCRYDE